MESLWQENEISGYSPKMNKIKDTLRKRTTPVHILCGIITVLAGVYIGWWLAGLLFLSFLLIEVWTPEEWKTSQDDFWEFVLAMFIMAGILLLAIGVLALIKFIL